MHPHSACSPRHLIKNQEFVLVTSSVLLPIRTQIVLAYHEVCFKSSNLGDSGNPESCTRFSGVALTCPRQVLPQTQASATCLIEHGIHRQTSGYVDEALELRFLITVYSEAQGQVREPFHVYRTSENFRSLLFNS